MIFRPNATGHLRQQFPLNFKKGTVFLHSQNALSARFFWRQVHWIVIQNIQVTAILPFTLDPIFYAI